MKALSADVFANIVTSSREAFCDMLHNPALWSEDIVKQTFERSGAQPFNIEDAQGLIKDYLTVLAEHIRKGETV